MPNLAGIKGSEDLLCNPMQCLMRDMCWFDKHMFGLHLGVAQVLHRNNQFGFAQFSQCKSTWKIHSYLNGGIL